MDENSRVQKGSSSFYERYWENPGGSPGEDASTIEERIYHLKKAFNELPANSPVLDAGCGSGEFVRFLSEIGFNVTGIDISSVAISRAKNAMPGAKLAVASLEQRIPFDEESFAAVWCTEVLEHLFDVHASLAELNRVLIPGGLFVATVPYHGLSKNLLVALFGFERHYNPYLSHIRFFTKKSLEACLKNAGFVVEYWSGVGRCWPMWKSLFVVARKKSEPKPPPEILG